MMKRILGICVSICLLVALDGQKSNATPAGSSGCVPTGIGRPGVIIIYETMEAWADPNKRTKQLIDRTEREGPGVLASNFSTCSTAGLTAPPQASSSTIPTTGSPPTTSPYPTGPGGGGVVPVITPYQPPVLPTRRGRTPDGPKRPAPGYSSALRSQRERLAQNYKKVENLWQKHKAELLGDGNSVEKILDAGFKDAACSIYQEAAAVSNPGSDPIYGQCIGKGPTKPPINGGVMHAEVAQKLTNLLIYLASTSDANNVQFDPPIVQIFNGKEVIYTEIGEAKPSPLENFQAFEAVIKKVITDSTGLNREHALDVKTLTDPRTRYVLTLSISDNSITLALKITKGIISIGPPLGIIIAKTPKI